MTPPHEDSSIAAAADKSEKELLVECLNRLSDFDLESRPKLPDPVTIRSDKLEKLYGFVIQVRTAMLQLYSRREPKVSSVLKLFSRDRLKKGNLSVAAYYAKWKESLAPSLVCTTDADKIQCYDLFLRSAFYYGLDDSFIHKELSNIKEADQSLKSFLEEAIAAESRAIHYKDTVNRSHALDHATDISTQPDIAGYGQEHSINSIDKRGQYCRKRWMNLTSNHS